MKREWKKKQKELKREKIRKDRLRKSIPNKWWPCIFCLTEKLFIAVCHEPMSFKNLRPKYKVDWRHWQEFNSSFREGYKIDMTKFMKNQVVTCPACKGNVDFRLWKSATLPVLIEVKNDKKPDIEKLPDT